MKYFSVVGWPWLAAKCLPTLSLTHPSQQSRGKNMVKQLMDEDTNTDTGSEIPYQLQSQAQQIQVGENSCYFFPNKWDLDGKKQTKKITPSYPLFLNCSYLLHSQLLCLSWLLAMLPPPHNSAPEVPQAWLRGWVRFKALGCQYWSCPAWGSPSLSSALRLPLVPHAF